MTVDLATLQLTADARGLERGATALDQLTARAGRAEDAALAVGAASRTMGAGAVLGGNGVRMVTMQLSQVVQQATATGNVLGALAVQAPDIGLAFGAVGTVVGAIAAIALPSLMASLGLTADGAKTVESALEDLRTTAETSEKVLKSLAMTTAELQSQFGILSDEAAEINMARATISVRELSDSATELVDVLTAMYNGNAWLNSSRAEELYRAFDLVGNQSERLSDALTALDNSVTLEQQVAAATALREMFSDMLGPAGDMSGEAFAFYTSIVDAEQALVETLDRTRELEAAARTIAPSIREQYVLWQESREAAAQTAAETLAAMGAQYQLYQGYREAAAQSAATASEMLADLQEEIRLRQAIVTYGQNSTQVERIRAEIERARLSAELQSLGIAGQNAQAILAASGHAARLNALISRYGASLGTAVGSAYALRDGLLAALGAANGLAGALRGVAGALGGVVARMGALGGIGNAVGNAGGILGGMFDRGSLDAASGAFAGATARLRELWGAAGQAVQSGQDLSDVLAGSGSGGGGGGAAGAAAQTAESLVTVEEALANIMGTTPQALEQFKAMADVFSNGLTSAVDYFVDGFKDGMSGLLRIFGDTLKRMVAQAANSRIAQAMSGQGGNVSGILGGISGFSSGIGSFLSGGFGAIGPALAGAGAGLTGLATAAGALALPVMGLIGIFNIFKRRAEERRRREEAIETERTKLLTSLWQLQGRTNRLRKAELAALNPANRALAERVMALRDEAAIENERRGLQERLWEMLGRTDLLRRRELAAINPANRALAERIFALEDEARAAERLARREERQRDRQERREERAADRLERRMSQRSDLERRLLELQGNTAELRRRELAELFPANRALQERIWKLQKEQERAEKLAARQEEIADERLGLEAELLRLQGNTAELRRRELEALHPSNRALQALIWGLEDAKEAIDALDPNNFATLFDFQWAKALAANGTRTSGGTVIPLTPGASVQAVATADVIELRAVRAELAAMRVEQHALSMQVAVNTKRELDLHRQWDADGMPPVRA